MNFFKRRFASRQRELRCSFCNKRQRDVLKLVAGPAAHICNECIAICHDLVRDDETAHLTAAQSKGEASACVLCKTLKPATDLLHVPNRGWVCFVCVAAIKVAAGSGWEFRSE